MVAPYCSGGNNGCDGRWKMEGIRDFNLATILYLNQIYIWESFFLPNKYIQNHVASQSCSRRMKNANILTLSTIFLKYDHLLLIRFIRINFDISKVDCEPFILIFGSTEFITP